MRAPRARPFARTRWTRARRLREGGATIYNDVVLNQVLVRLVDGPTTEALIAAVQADGRTWCGPTQWGGATAMRISVSSWKTDLDAAALAADAILELGAGAVLVKGGHLDEERAADLFVDAGGEEWVVADRIDTPNTHGTGCTLSAAITAHLAKGATLRDAVLAGKAFVTEAIRSSLAIGGGIGPVDPLWAIEP